MVRGVLALVLLLVTATADDLPALLDGASKAREAGDWARARELLAQAYAIKPAAEILYNRARVAESMDLLAEAASLYTTLLVDQSVAPEILAKAKERAQTLSALLKTGALRVESERLEIDGRKRGVGLIGVEPPDAVLSVLEPDGLRAMVIGVVAGRVERVSAESVASAATACLDLGGAALVAFDDHPLASSAPRLCLPPGPHTLTLADRQPFAIELMAGDVNAIPPRVPPSSQIPSIVLFAGGGAALAASGIAFAIAGSERASVTGATVNSEGLITSISQVNAYAARDAGNRAATMSAVFLVSGLVLSAGGALFLAL